MQCPTPSPSQALAAAIKAIDEQFGPGYAAANPALVAGMVQAVAMLEIDKTLGDGFRNLGH
jgi:hypothetical protein